MKDLLGMSREEFNNFMNSFDTVVTDCDGNMLQTSYQLLYVYKGPLCE